MPLITREEKGSKLTIAEMDGNLTYLEEIGRPYTSYIALLAQSGTDAPVATVLENTIGNITWGRSDAGEYGATLNGAFIDNKTIVTTHAVSRGLITAVVSSVTSDEIKIEIYDKDGNKGDDLLEYGSSIEIRVYN